MTPVESLLADLVAIPSMNPMGRGRTAHFTALDANKDGAVSKDEYQAETTTMFAARDANKDGRLTPDEFGPMHRMRGPQR